MTSEPQATKDHPSDTEPSSGRHLSRRSLIVGGGIAAVALLAAGAGGEALISSLTKTAPPPTVPITPRPTTDISYVSTQLTNASTASWKTGETAPGLIFGGPRGKSGKFNGLVMDETGEAVWIEPTKVEVTDLRTQTYLGKPVITYWTGKSIGGHGQGTGVILDSHYKKIAEVKGGNGFRADLHEFLITDRGTALITAYSTVPHDLRPLGGVAKGFLYDCHVQEIDIATGAIVLDWSALDHLDVTETYLGLHDGNGGNAGADGATKPNAFDPFHVNSVEPDGDTLLVSMRHTHTIYQIDRKTGKVNWRLGGKHSDWKVADEAVFAWQHDVRKHASGISLFDNHYYSGTKGESRGMFFRLDASTMTAVNTRNFTFQSHLGTATGSVQLLPNQNVLVGWGTAPYVTEFTPDGTAIYQAAMSGATYRAYRALWSAQPTTLPDIALKTAGSGKLSVYASWNGATEVASWRVLSGVSASALSPATTVPRTGFETTATIANASKVAVQALDSSGSVLATSKVVSV
jgi:hypothetical protein